MSLIHWCVIAQCVGFNDPQAYVQIVDVCLNEILFENIWQVLSKNKLSLINFSIKQFRNILTSFWREREWWVFRKFVRKELYIVKGDCYWEQGEEIRSIEYLSERMSEFCLQIWVAFRGNRMKQDWNKDNCFKKVRHLLITELFVLRNHRFTKKQINFQNRLIWSRTILREDLLCILDALFKKFANILRNITHSQF